MKRIAMLVACAALQTRAVADQIRPSHKFGQQPKSNGGGTDVRSGCFRFRQ